MNSFRDGPPTTTSSAGKRRRPVGESAMPWRSSVCPRVDARAHTRVHRSSGRVVAHAESRAAIDPSAPPSFLPLVLTSHANVATEQPPSRRTTVRWGCRFDSRVTTSPSRAPSRLADRRVPSGVRQSRQSKLRQRHVTSQRTLQGDPPTV